MSDPRDIQAGDQRGSEGEGEARVQGEGEPGAFGTGAWRLSGESERRALGTGESHALGAGQPGMVGREQVARLAADAPERLEHLIHGIAQSQPRRRAPASLEARVFARIAARPWWRRGFVHWPLWARGTFLVVSVGFVRLALAAFAAVTDLARVSPRVDAIHQTRQAVSTTVSLGELVLHAIPPGWLYAGATVGFTLYAVLFALGTFAYRTLYVQR